MFGLSQNNCPLEGEGLALQSCKRTPRAWQIAQALGEYGEVVARTRYGGSDSILECEAVFVLKSGSCPASITLGAGTNVESLQIATSNSEYPKYTVKWREGLPNVSGLSFTVRLPTVLPRRCAQNLGLSVGAGAKLNSSTYTCTVEYGEALDDAGSLAACSWTGGKAEVTAEAVSVTAQPVFTAAEGWDVEESGAGIDEGNTAYGTASAKASRALVAD